MVRLLALIALLFAAALGLQTLKDTSGEVAVTVGDTAYAVDLTTAIVALVLGLAVLLLVLALLRALLRAPVRISRGHRRRGRRRGEAAIRRGMIAIAAGDVRGAEQSALEAAQRLPDAPLTRLLGAQAAQLRGDRKAALDIFREMAADPATHIAGLRGLHIEAEREGDAEAAFRLAELAHREAPGAPWAARAVLRHQTAASEWDEALKTLSDAANSRILDRRTARRQRAVILTAKAGDREEGEPERARAAALEAHDLAPDLVPAATVAARLLARHGDVRRAIRILETAWKAAPHPEIADAYAHVRSGDSAKDRLKRAETLHALRREADAGRLAVARAALEAREFARAREVLVPVLQERPTRRALVLMAGIEEAETGDRGRAREWLARALNAPRDPAWTADGMVLEHWAPVSPLSGRLDAVEWKVPVAEDAPPLSIDAADLAPPPPVPTPPPRLAPAPPPSPSVAAEPEIAPPAAPVPPQPVPPAFVPLPVVAGAPPAAPLPEPAPAPARTNGSGEEDAIAPPPHGATPEGISRDAEPLVPRPPDDPGVDGQAAPTPPERRSRFF